MSMLNILKHPKRVFAKRMVDKKWGYAIIPILIICPFASIFSLFSIFAQQGNLSGLAKELVVLYSVILGTYPLSCLAFYFTAIILKSPASYKQILSTWGYSYYPTLSFLIYLLGATFVLPVGIPLYALGIVDSILFIGLLIAIFLWKVIFFFLELRVVLKLNLWQMVCASAIIAILFLVYWIVAGSVFGFKVPLV